MEFGIIQTWAALAQRWELLGEGSRVLVWVLMFACTCAACRVSAAGPKPAWRVNKPWDLQIWGLVA